MSTASSLVSPPVPLAAAPHAVRVVIGGNVAIPAEVFDLESFCRWAVSDEYPERGQFSYLHGTIWVDLSMEDIYRHNQVKEAIGRVLGQLILDTKMGRFLPDGVLLRNSTADLSTEPDGMFVSYDALRSERVRRLEGKTVAGYLQLDGSPEMVLEVVSETSVPKDTVDLRELYWRAGIAEYWLVDARAAEPRFDILRHGRKGYTTTRKQAGGWLKSNVFARSFQLTQTPDPLGDPLYVLNVRE
ncbi:MAG TPA: Uma2 family endonuclease [Gemmataceae bacterium]|nr:Uma2 family endonuclease [Gemmataceae bacterium]